MFKWVRKLVDLFNKTDESIETLLTQEVLDERQQNILYEALDKDAFHVSAQAVSEDVPTVSDLLPEEEKDVSPASDLSYKQQLYKDALYAARHNPAKWRLREHFIDDIRTTYDMWQSNIVPAHICEAMVEPLPVDALFLVLFAPEFVEALVYNHNVDPENIIFFGDDDGLNGAVKMLYGVHKGGILNKDMSTLSSILTEGITVKFDKLVVVGNPPYQEMDGGEGVVSASPIYNKFVEIIIDNLSPDYLTFIVPSKWMTGGKGLDSYRQRMLMDRRMTSITHFPNSGDVFPTVSIEGGVSYFLWEKAHKNSNDNRCLITVGDTKVKKYLDEHDIVLLDLDAESILNKVQECTTSYMSMSVLPQKPFGIRNNFSDWKEAGIPCYKRGRELRYCDEDVVTDRYNIINKWKVCVSAANGAAQKEDGVKAKNVLTYTLLLPPGTTCTESYVVLNTFEVNENAEAFITYVKTKFFRFMLGLRVLTPTISRDKFSWVPDMGDYTKEWTDTDLYDMFNLSDDERAYIEAKIKPLV